MKIKINNMKTFSIYNGFGITPTKNYEAAGYDFYIPLIREEDKVIEEVLTSFSRSYKLKRNFIDMIYNEMSLQLEAKYGEKAVDNGNVLNCMHLMLALNTGFAEYDEEYIEQFIDSTLIFNKNFIPGIVVHNGDTVLFNSGIKTRFPENMAGIFFNKSGKASKGWDIRACVVDEDYTDYVHLSLMYSNTLNSTVIYCGDKLTQMVLLETPKTDIVEVSDKEFAKLHEESKRGNNGFGSSDVKH